jgi:transmembrane sensor
VPKPIDPRLPDDDALVDRLLSGTASADEIAGLTPDERAAIEAYKAALDARQGITDVWRRIEAAEPRPRPARPPLTLVRTPSHASPSHRETLSPTLARCRTAAAILAIVGLGVAGAFHWLHTRPDNRPIATVAIVTPRGQRLTTKLPDGTTLVLAPDSRVTYDASRFASRDREVTLVGQANFTVVHHPDRPFTVRAGQLVTRDVATIFAIRAYPEAPTRVAVAEGSVAVARSSTRLVLTAGMAAVAPSDPSVASNTLIASAADSAADFGWVDGSLSFRDAPLAEIAAAFSRRFDVALVLGDSALRAQHLTIEFPPATTPDQACAMIAVLVEARCRRDGGVIRLVPQL